jgi:hypothetical protein
MTGNLYLLKDVCKFKIKNSQKEKTYVFKKSNN